MRFFIALEVPQHSKKQLQQIQSGLAKILPNIRLTDSDKLHLTITFIGEQPENLKQKLILLLQQATRQIPAFTVTPSFIDGFPHLHNAHVLWAGVKGDVDKLFILRHHIKDGLIKLNLGVDERRYTPHIALAKFSNLTISESQEKQIERLMDQSFDPIYVTSIKLFESIPNHDFHFHNTLALIPLLAQSS